MLDLPKRCSDCLRAKPLSAFGIDKSRLDGLSYVCRQCRKALRPRALRKTPEERFASLTDVSDPGGCHEWIGQRSAFGYGLFWADGATHPAHRWLWKRKRGPLPRSLCVCHACDNPSCVNLGHLFLGTAADNNADRDAKNRTCKGDAHPARQPGARVGSRNGRAILSETLAASIRAAWAASDKRKGVQTGIARTLGVSHNIVWSAIHRRTWRHV